MILFFLHIVLPWKSNVLWNSGKALCAPRITVALWLIDPICHWCKKWSRNSYWSWESEEYESLRSRRSAGENLDSAWHGTQMLAHHLLMPMYIFCLKYFKTNYLRWQRGSIILENSASWNAFYFVEQGTNSTGLMIQPQTGVSPFWEYIRPFLAPWGWFTPFLDKVPYSLSCGLTHGPFTTFSGELSQILADSVSCLLLWIFSPQKLIHLCHTQCLIF